ncbi:MarR family winged helix-turn-helix transcriptional regulator [Streptomyces sp. NPDC093546]|uniref:MarR family winged helix-turn-helix transcriptional regulator n=1 Tax=Streptomyces sp. NPDC093546 TaxID=3366040 RepID=UPI003801160D
MPETSADPAQTDRVAAVLVACLPALNRALDRRIVRDLPFPRLPEAQLALLRLVAEREGATVRQCAEALMMKPNNVSALVSALTDQGLLERRQDTADKRIAHLYPTETAKSRLAEVRNLKARHLSEALDALTDGELDALGSALGALVSLTRTLHPASQR